MLLTKEHTTRILFSYKSMHQLVSGFLPKKTPLFVTHILLSYKRKHRFVSGFLSKSTPICHAHSAFLVSDFLPKGTPRTFCFFTKGHTIDKRKPRSCCFLTKAYLTKEYTTQSLFYPRVGGLAPGWIGTTVAWHQGGLTRRPSGLAPRPRWLGT